MSEITTKNLRSSGDTPLNNIPLTESADKNGIIQYGIGFDVHKDRISVCVAAQLVTGNIIEVKSHVFNSMPSGIEEIIGFLRKYNPISMYLMECTGVYHLPLYHALRNAFSDHCNKVIAMNPLLLNRRITDLGKKTDHVDAKSLAFITFYKSLIKPSYIGTMQFFRLRDMIRSYHKTNTQSTACKNRIHRLLYSINAKLELELNAEWCIMLLDRIANSNGTILDVFDQLIHDRIQGDLPIGIYEKQREKIIPIGHIVLSEEDKFILRMELGRLLQEQIVAASFLKEAERLMMNDIKNLRIYQELNLIPGLGSMGALTILLELGDYTRFRDWKAFLKFCGAVPTIEESGNHKTKGHVNRFSNKYVRYILTQSAGVLINRCDRSTDLGEFAFKQFKIKNIPYKKAILKVANKLAKTIFNVLTQGIEYQPNYEQYERKKQKQITYLKKNDTLLEAHRTRALRRDINQFVGSNYEYLNSSSRFQIVTGFQKMIQKARYLDQDKT